MNALVQVHLPPDEVDELDLLVEGEAAVRLDLHVVEGVHHLQVVEQVVDLGVVSRAEQADGPREVASPVGPIVLLPVIILVLRERTVVVVEAGRKLVVKVVGGACSSAPSDLQL